MSTSLYSRNQDISRKLATEIPLNRDVLLNFSLLSVEMTSYKVSVAQDMKGDQNINQLRLKDLGICVWTKA